MNRFLMLPAALCALSTVANAQVAQLKFERKNDYRKVYRLYIRHKKTSLTFEGAESPIFGPDVSASRTKKGVVYGLISETSSGAITVGNDLGFAQYRGQVFGKPGFGVDHVRNEQLLFVHRQSGPWLEESNAFLFEKGQFVDVGYAHEAGYVKDGSIVGWYYAHEDGTRSAGQGADFDLGTYKQYFEFKNGVRTLTGRKLIYG